MSLTVAGPWQNFTAFPILRMVRHPVCKVSIQLLGDYSTPPIRAQEVSGEHISTVLSRIKKLPYLEQQYLCGEGLFQERRPLIQYTMVEYHVICVPRHVEHLHLWLHGLKTFRQFTPTHLWHHDIRQQEVNLFLVLLTFITTSVSRR